MTAPRLSLNHARSFEVPCRWNGSGVDVPAVVTVSRWEGSWWASVTPDGWATLWLGTEPQEPWGLWMTSGSPKRDHTFPSAQEAVDAAFATEQIEPRGDQG